MGLFSKRLENPKTGKVLQVYVDGTRVQLIRFKKNVDAPAEDELVQLKTHEAAMQTATRFIEAQFKKGYVDVSGPKPQLALRKGETPREALSRLAPTSNREDLERFSEQHAKELFGELAPSWNVEFIDARWTSEGLSAITIAPSKDGSDLECHELTRALLALPLAHHLRELTFGVASFTKHAATEDWSRSFAELCAAPCAPGLTRLAFDYAADEFVPPLDTITIGDLSQGFDRLAALDALVFRGRGLKWSGARLPSCRSIKWQCTAFTQDDITELLTAKLPALDRLDLVGEVDEAIALQLLEGLARCAPASVVQMSPRKLEAATVTRMNAFNSRAKPPKIRRKV